MWWSAWGVTSADSLPSRRSSHRGSTDPAQQRSQQDQRSPDPRSRRFARCITAKHSLDVVDTLFQINSDVNKNDTKLTAATQSTGQPRGRPVLTNQNWSLNAPKISLFG